MGILIDFRTRKRIPQMTKAIEFTTNSIIVRIPDCYSSQTIDETERLIKLEEPLEPSMRERIELTTKALRPVVIKYYKMGELYNEAV